MEKPKTIEEYLAKLPKEQAKALRALRKTIKSVIPKETVEKISWGMPMYYYKGMFLAFAAFKNHMSLVTMNSKVQKKFAKELKGRTITKGTIHFTPEKPIPASLVKKIVQYRIKEKKQ